MIIQVNKWCFFICVCLVFTGKSQTVTPSPNKLDDQYTPAGNLLFTDINNRKRTSIDKSAAINMAIKIVPFDLLRGNATCEAEIAITEGNSIIFGGGYNIMNDFVLSNFNSGFFSNSNTESLGLSSIVQNSVYDRGGVCFTVGFRSYVDQLKIRSYGYAYENPGKALNDWYRSVSFKYSSSNYILDTLANYSGKQVSGDNHVSMKNYWLLSGIGFSGVLNGSVKTVHDFYINVGVRIVRYTDYKLNESYNPATLQVSEYYKSSGTYRFSLLFPAIHVGYSIGFGF